MTSVYVCTCGEHAPSMTAFVDHVSVDHDALDIAVDALLDGERELEVADG